MRIPEKLLTEWNELRSPNDANIIAEKAGVSRNTIYRAFTDEVCNDAVFEAMSNYFKEKKAIVDNILSDFQN